MSVVIHTHIDILCAHLVREPSELDSRGSVTPSRRMCFGMLVSFTASFSDEVLGGTQVSHRRS
jgi:hypothetical protein